MAIHILKALDPIEKLELKIADLYEWFSLNMNSDPEAAAFFFRMSVDESAHANLVKYQRRLVTQNMKLFGDITIDIEGIRKVIAQVDAVRSGNPPTVAEAFRIALEIETSAAETHYLTAIKEAAAGISGLLSSLGALDCAHCGVFEEFAKNRGYAAATDSLKIISDYAAPAPETPHVPEAAEPLSIELLEKIDYYYTSYNRMDFYEILGVKDYAGSAAIKHAFHERAKEFHPDRLMKVSDELKQKLNAIFGRMTLAYSTLMNPDKRKEYETTRHARTR